MKDFSRPTEGFVRVSPSYQNIAHSALCFVHKLCHSRVKGVGGLNRENMSVARDSIYERPLCSVA